MPRFNACTIRPFAASLVAAALLGPHAAGAEEWVGKAAAVNPKSEGIRGNAAARVLVLGSELVADESIRTSAEGNTQILFIDKTTLNVGPSSLVVIDRFVFNPSTDTGQATISFGKGIMRFVGGDISHSAGATILTDVATVGIRGGSGTFDLTGDGLVYIHHYGTATVSNACGQVVISRPGFSTTVSGPNDCPSTPQRTTRAQTDRALSLLTSGPGQTGGGTFTGDGPEIVGTYEGGRNRLPDDLQRDLDDLVREQVERFNTQDGAFGGPGIDGNGGG